MHTLNLIFDESTYVVMNEKRKIDGIMLSCTLIFSLIAATSIGTIGFQAFGQQNTSDASTESLESLMNGINKTRQALQTNDTAAALESLNEMDSQLFEIRSSLPSSSE